MDLVVIFFFLASFTLLRLVWGDLKDFKVDERLSYYMFGVTGCIFLVLDLILVWIVLTFITGFALAYFKKKTHKKAQIAGKPHAWHENLIGNGDITILSWVVPSLFVLNWMWGIAFTMLFCTSIMFTTILSKKQIIPGTIPITIALLCTWFMQLNHFI